MRLSSAFMWPCSHSARPRALGTLVAFACLTAFGLGLPGAAGAAPRLHPRPAASASLARSEAARVARYWTPARMRGARPLDGGPAPRGGDAGASFATVLDSTVPPYSVNGRLFIRRGGQSGYCSATAINSPTRRLVLTAGHCVNSGPLEPGHAGIWSKFMQFVPAYNDGVAPFGAFVARRGAIFAPKPFVKGGNPDYDVGAFLTFPNAAGQNVADAVGGGATIVTDQSRNQEFQTFGYPGTARALQHCESPYVGDDSLTYPLGGPPTIAIRCRWTPGASGGGWLIAEGTAINGLTSYGHRGDRRHTFSPYFGSGNVGALVKGL
jgi:hypothetical protein